MISVGGGGRFCKFALGVTMGSQAVDVAHI